MRRACRGRGSLRDPRVGLLLGRVPRFDEGRGGGGGTIEGVRSRGRGGGGRRFVLEGSRRRRERFVEEGIVRNAHCLELVYR